MLQVHSILAAALEMGPILLAPPTSSGPAEGKADSAAAEEAAEAGASTGALSDAALLASSVLASQPAAEVSQPCLLLFISDLSVLASQPTALYALIYPKFDARSGCTLVSGPCLV